ncbi:glycoside hydrolase superfamily, partial [Calycina marina]
MFSIKSLATATTALSLIASSHATYYPESTSNLAVYWGQGANQATLAEFCKDSPVEIVPVAFINRFTAQANGWVGDNYGNACWAGEYKAPGWPTTANYTPDNDKLYTTCQPVREGIPACQGSGKKVILSLGGAWSLVGSPYQLTGRDEGNALAEFLWGAYGTYDANSDYILAGNPRPLDGGLLGTDGTHIDIDGFDFDIEHAPTDGGEGYIACIKRLRELFTAKGLPNKQYMITGAPQCIYPDANMGSMIAGVQFDALFIQFYNSEQCAANNPGFNFDQWTEITGPSANAKLYIGLLGSPAASTAVNSTGGSYYVPTADAKALIQAYSMHEKFGGVMVWEATTATQN